MKYRVSMVCKFHMGGVGWDSVFVEFKLEGFQVNDCLQLELGGCKMYTGGVGWY